MKRSHGTRQGTRSILSKSKSQRSRLNISKIMHSYSKGDKVSIVIDGAQQKGMPHRRFQGVTGTVAARQGRAYVVDVKDKNMAKTLIIRPEHMKPADGTPKPKAPRRQGQKAKKEATAQVTDSKPESKKDKKEAELQRVRERAKSIDFEVLGTANASDKDDLQAIKGVGPFIEEKLNALGIYTYLQISKMKGDLEDQVNEAIEFFPGRVKRDEWVNQAKDMLNEEE
ncbi:MAG: 50S ribosomal protein L21e [Candidatus Thalassarchaeaceae archaeon]